MVYLSMPLVLENVLAHHGNSLVGEQVRTALENAKPVSDELATRSLKLVLQSYECKTKGSVVLFCFVATMSGFLFLVESVFVACFFFGLCSWVLDDWPQTEKQAWLMCQFGIVPHLVFYLDLGGPTSLLEASKRLKRKNAQNEIAYA